MIWNGLKLRKLPAEIQQTARRKMRMIHNAQSLTDLRIPPANRLEALKGDRTGQHSILINDQWRIVSSGRKEMLRVWKSRTTIEVKEMKERLRNIHPGEVLREEFLTPLEITAYRLSKETGIPQTAISEITHGRRRITAAVALKFAKYFGTSPQFWMGLQDDFDLEEQELAMRDELERIHPLSLGHPA